ncbi:LAGLIDADG family homing endonuclease [Deinococcus sp.]|uniref:LAGLIDADG family homing endonuclease n=1 Tax=Deinococcus sp. TaxID=47478 RepID=UPI003CC6ABFA
MTTLTTPALANFDDNAQHIAKRQYFQEGDQDLSGLFRRVADWVAAAEAPEARASWAQRYYDLMADKRFCPGGRVMAGAGTQHGNVLNCFVQGATAHDPSSFEGVMEVAKKLALVTKVGGGNGVNLDVYRPRVQSSRADTGVRGWAYMGAEHPDVQDFVLGMMRPPTQPDGDKQPVMVRNWTRVVYGQAIPPELVALARQHGVQLVRSLPEGVGAVQDDMGGIIDAARQVAEQAKLGLEPRLDLSAMRPEGAPIRGSGGTSSGPVSFLLEIFDNFLEWANRGAEDSGPINTLRFVYSPVLRVVRQGGTRRGAGMATISVDHPDVLDFLTAKDLDREAAEGDISTFNISILITSAFWDTLQAGRLWPLKAQEVPGKYHLARLEGGYPGIWPELPERADDGARAVPLYSQQGQSAIPAAWLWREIARHAWSTGEPGLIFVDRINDYSALKELGERYQIRSTNPCVTGDTWVSTAVGARQVSQLIGKDFCATVNGQTYDARGGFWLTGIKSVLKLRTKRGYELRLTDNHRLLKVTKQTRDRQETAWTETGLLKAGDLIMLGDHRGVRSWAGRGNRTEGWVLGSLIGDGTFITDKARPMAALGFWGEERGELADLAETQLRALGAAKNLWRSNDDARGRIRLSSEALAELAARYGVVHGHKTLTGEIEQGGYEFYRGVLQGLFDADGSVQGDQRRGVSVRLAQSDLLLLQRTQRMLARLGILSTVYPERRPAAVRALPDGKGGLSDCAVKAQHELVISASNLQVFADVVGFRSVVKAGRLAEHLNSYVRTLNRERFSDEIVSIEADGEEAVYDVTVETIHAFDANCILAHNCGEIPLTVGEPCDLGAINLAAYVSRSSFDFSAFRADVRTCVRFLDDVLDVNVFALEDNRVASQDLRRLGLGVMGLADALIKLGLRYDSEAGREAIYSIMSALREEAVAASERLGQERGAYPVYQRHADQIPHGPRRNVAVLTVAPTGCVVPNTLVSTDRGMRRIVTLGNPSGQQWQNLDTGVYTDEGVKRATKFFVNGFQPVKRVTTSRGFSMAATANHQVRVIEEGGEYVWRRMDALNVGDQVLLKRNTIDDAPMVNLELAEIGVNGVSTVPGRMNVDLAELLGLYMGDGYIKEKGGLHIVIGNADVDLKERISHKLMKVFTAQSAPVEEKLGCCIVMVNGRCISRFFNLNNFAKPKGNYGEGAEGAFIPDAILASGAQAVRAFLRGLFEADGTVTQQGRVALSSVSLTLMQQVQAAMLGLGMVTSLRQMPTSTGRFGQRPIFELSLLNRHEVDAFRTKIGFLSARKRETLDQVATEYAKCDVFTNPLLLEEFYQASRGLANETRQGLNKRVHANAALSQPYVKELLGQHPQLQETRLGRLSALDVFIDTVAVIEDGFSETYDLSVPENVTYIANGFISHNTTSMLMGVSSGIEPVFSPFIWRKIGSEYRALLAPLFVELLESYPPAADMKAEQGGWNWDKVTQAVSENHGSVVGLAFIPQALQQVFVCAHDVSPLDHVRMQGAVQQAFDASGYAANSLSKTINLPEQATVQEIEDAYSEAYKTGCKGITVYRDGSRQFQVLSTSKKAKQPGEQQADDAQPEASQSAAEVMGEAPAPAVAEAAVASAPAAPAAQPAPRAVPPSQPLYMRPGRLHGVTDMVKLTDPTSGHRRSFLVTVNCLEEKPVEVMVISGRAGDEANADSEALGRVVSIALQYGVPAQAIIKTLRGLSGGLYGSYNGRLVGSKADLIAVALETFAQEQDASKLPVMAGGSDMLDAAPAGAHGVSVDGMAGERCPVCDERAVIREEGCLKCQACGHSKCG